MEPCLPQTIAQPIPTGQSTRTPCSQPSRSPTQLAPAAALARALGAEQHAPNRPTTHRRRTIKPGESIEMGRMTSLDFYLHATVAGDANCDSGLCWDGDDLAREAGGRKLGFVKQELPEGTEFGSAVEWPVTCGELAITARVRLQHACGCVCRPCLRGDRGWRGERAWLIQRLGGTNRGMFEGDRAAERFRACAALLFAGAPSAHTALARPRPCVRPSPQTTISTPCGARRALGPPQTGGRSVSHTPLPARLAAGSRASRRPAAVRRSSW